MSISSSSGSSKEERWTSGEKENVDIDQVGSSSYVVMKRKRTKRQRINNQAIIVNQTTPPASSTASSTTEEEDMASCLILLAQGPKVNSKITQMIITGGDRNTRESTVLVEAPAPKVPVVERKKVLVGDGGLYMYECKTCNKRFPSFQALGGHRTSHKKPKLSSTGIEDKAPPAIRSNKLQIGEVCNLQMGISTSSSSFHKQVSIANDGNQQKQRVHECSICGSEFPSGQALGGHMRRHRPIAVPTKIGPIQTAKKERSVLSLDLNLPAPFDHDDQGDLTKFSSSSSTSTFNSGTAGKPSTILFTALVDCNY